MVGVKKHFIAVAAIIIGVTAVSILWHYVGDNKVITNLLHIVNVSAIVYLLYFSLTLRGKLLEDTRRIHKLQLEAKEAKKAQSFINDTIINNSNFNHNLANIVAGINHELSPWLGGTVNVLTQLRGKIESDSHENKTRYLAKIDLVLEALTQAIKIMSVVSRNIKHLKLHSNDKSNLRTTVESWIGVLFINESIKRNLQHSQIDIHYESIDFEVTHSPMLLSQVFLNLVKNTIDHNANSLATIKIKIYGDGKNTLVVEDNGCGVSEQMLGKLFRPEVTTKADGEIHGLGLSICKEYCKLMRATIAAERVQAGGLKFLIKFDDDDVSGSHQIIPDLSTQ